MKYFSVNAEANRQWGPKAFGGEDFPHRSILPWYMSSRPNENLRRSDEGPTPNQPLNAILPHLTDIRRQILRCLSETDTPVDERELATMITSERNQTAASDERIDRCHIELQHRHLPVLANADLITWDRHNERVQLTDHDVFADPWFRRLLDTNAELDDVITCLVDDRSRRILAVLDDADGALTRDELAEELSTTNDTAKIGIALHHVHLPKLADHGLIEYNDEENPLVRRVHSDIEQAWFSIFLDG